MLLVCCGENEIKKGKKTSGYCFYKDFYTNRNIQYFGSNNESVVN